MLLGLQKNPAQKGLAGKLKPFMLIVHNQHPSVTWWYTSYETWRNRLKNAKDFGARHGYVLMCDVKNAGVMDGQKNKDAT